MGGYRGVGGDLQESGWALQRSGVGLHGALQGSGVELCGWGFAEDWGGALQGNLRLALAPAVSSQERYWSPYYSFVASGCAVFSSAGQQWRKGK